MQLEDLTELTWRLNIVTGTGTGGCLLKAEVPPHYYKLSTYTNSVIGHEAINEVIVSRLLDQLGIPHIQYNLHNALITVDGSTFPTALCSSKEFKVPGETKTTMEKYFKSNRINPKETPIEFMRRVGFEEYLNQMLFVDFLIINRDRHGSNLEVLSSGNATRIAPLFDHGLSLVAPQQFDLQAVQNFDPMQDKEVNNFFGTKSLFENLRFISKPIQVATAQINFDVLFMDIDTFLSEHHLNKIQDIIERRLEYAKQKNLFVSAEGYTSCFT